MWSIAKRKKVFTSDMLQSRSIKSCKVQEHRHMSKLSTNEVWNNDFLPLPTNRLTHSCNLKKYTETHIQTPEMRNSQGKHWLPETSAGICQWSKHNIYTVNSSVFSLSCSTPLQLLSFRPNEGSHVWVSYQEKNSNKFIISLCVDVCVSNDNTI